ncbi:DUF58 domain-containing protein [Bacillus sp. 1P10SD]|uniref:DUF58 domain-containing protein n=1 Tax=Bacillus sp. 1P10SD TaxID=3132265 RepID=UPI0039A6F5BF
MTWSKYSVEDRKIPGISIFAILLIFVSIYMESKLVLFLAIFFLVIVVANNYYLKKAGDKLYLDNIYEKKHFFIEDNGQWSFIFKNEGLPILKGDLRVYFDHFVVPKGEEIESNSSMYDISIPFSIFSKQTKQVVIPFGASRRGIARIRKLEFHVPSLLGFGEIILESKTFLRQQAVVYPQPIPVKGLIEKLSVLQGVNAVPFSVYEDRLGPLGTRDYVSSDSFNRIHWKASAKKQTLQTKVFEKISEKGWNIALNVSNGHSITSQIEKLISGITEIAYYACNKQIPYSLCINVRTAGSTPFLFLPKGEGKEQLQKALEMLASISTQNTSIPYEYMLSFYNRHLTSQPFFIHTGIRTVEDNRMLLRVVQRGAKLLELTIEQEHGVLSELVIQNDRRVRL